MVLAVSVSVSARRPMPTRGLARMATTGIYLAAAPRPSADRARPRRARGDHAPLSQGVRESAAGPWTPQPHDTVPESAHDPCGWSDGPA